MDAIARAVDLDPGLSELVAGGGLRVVTVDGAQGSEADYVVLSMVRCAGPPAIEGRANIGFLNKRSRLCVALSRARRLLLVVGHATTMLSSRNDVLARLYQACASRPFPPKPNRPPIFPSVWPKPGDDVDFRLVPEHDLAYSAMDLLNVSVSAMGLLDISSTAQRRFTHHLFRASWQAAGGKEGLIRKGELPLMRRRWFRLVRALLKRWCPARVKVIPPPRRRPPLHPPIPTPRSPSLLACSVLPSVGRVQYRWSSRCFRYDARCPNCFSPILYAL